MDATKIQEMLAEKSDEIVAAVRANVIERATANLDGQIAALITAEVKTYFAAEIAPKIVEALNGDKGKIIEAANVAASNIAVALAEKMSTEAVTAISESYRFGEIMKQMFRGY